MRRKISQADVEIALARLESMAKPPTLDAVRSALGNQGSRSTIVKLLKNIREMPNTTPALEKSIMPMPSYLLRTDFYEKVDGAESMEGAINYLITEKSDPTGIMSDLCVVIQRLRLEVTQCQSEVVHIRNLHKNMLNAMQSAIKE
ncbi:DNA-binding protein [Pseudomonas sp. 43NM1]|uniref:DNA-binding protein n=1 Tax=Pseudomonas sp. 43NM1 TaxID=1904755 RepID=UPI0012FF49F8|nr:DNA-binding protein [Pseudomonas sp. 43NM1]